MQHILTKEEAKEIEELTGHNVEELASFNTEEVEDEEQEGGYFPPSTHTEIQFTLK